MGRTLTRKMRNREMGDKKKEAKIEEETIRDGTAIDLPCPHFPFLPLSHLLSPIYLSVAFCAGLNYAMHVSAQRFPDLKSKI
jgi:hypothetical protein